MALIPSPVQYLPLSGGTVTGNLSVTGHISGTGSAAGAAAGSNAGTIPPAPVVTTGSTDDSGVITFGTGTTPAAGVMVAVTFAAAWVIPGGGPPSIVAAPQNAATQALGIFISGVSPTGFNISCTTAPAASQANSTYSVAYQAIG